jgi:hypothetical protein
MRCKECWCLNYDFFEHRNIDTGRPRCGLHGGATVNPDGPQVNLDNRGGCGFIPKGTERQLTLF